ncbi:hypothetical protein GQ53DRAFT_518645 [Thozetella sp. PMI_491]|nr:hypothetical protein GQ53DRAFT_518645 [Thozetella sp. PMI_491]
MEDRQTGTGAAAGVWHAWLTRTTQPLGGGVGQRPSTSLVQGSRAVRTAALRALVEAGRRDSFQRNAAHPGTQNALPPRFLGFPPFCHESAADRLFHDRPSTTQIEAWVTDRREAAVSRTQKKKKKGNSPVSLFLKPQLPSPPSPGFRASTTGNNGVLEG